MTIQELRALIAEGESLTLEFKRDLPLSDNELVEAVVCLANSKGGVFLLGVENNGTMSYLHSHGRISRREVAELCQITLKQAEYLLKKLREEKKIKLAKRGRNAFYVLETPKRS